MLYSKIKNTFPGVNDIKSKLKFKAYKIIFYIIGIIVLIKSIKYFIGRLLSGDKSHDEKYDKIVKSLDNLQKQNEELRKINEKLLETKYK